MTKKDEKDPKKVFGRIREGSEKDHFLARGLLFQKEKFRQARGGWLKKVFTGYFSAVVAGGKTTGYLSEKGRLTK